TNGRIFKIAYQDRESRERKRPETVDLSKKTDAELVELQLHKNDWYVRTARRLLMERATAKKLDPKVRERLAEIAFRHKDATRRLRGLWALHVTGGLSESQVKEGLSHQCQHVNAWTIQLACEEGKPSDTVLDVMRLVAKLNSSPMVRLYLASA